MSAESSLLRLVRPSLLALKPYSSARSLNASGLLLDANESPWTLVEDDEMAGLNRYPMPQPSALLAAAARYYKVQEPSILISRGSDEGIDLLVRAFCEASRDRLLICPPTYGVYEVAARIQGCEPLAVPLRPDFTVDADAIVSAQSRSPQTKLVFLCSPNNPTGGTIARSDVERLCRELDGKAIVVVDEAYQEFADAPSLCDAVGRWPNLVLLRTLSKAWGLAGARCGFTLAHPALISVLQRIRAPYPMSAAAVRVVERVFTPAGEKRMRSSVIKLIAQRRRLQEALGPLPGVRAVYPSEANFLLVRLIDSAALLAEARRAGIVLRDRGSEPGLAGCVRVTVGSAAENGKLIATFRAFAAGRSSKRLSAAAS